MAQAAAIYGDVLRPQQKTNPHAVRIVGRASIYIV
jgi:hypothetical protein